MITQSFAVSIVVSTVALSADCASCGNVQTATPSTQPTANWRDAYFRFDDPRASDDQRRAMRAAAMAIVGTSAPSVDQAERLHFSCAKLVDGWSVTVWRFGPSEIPAPGVFQDVTLDHDFNVRSARGGA